MAPGETIEQEFVFTNDGSVSWPQDTFFIYSGGVNTLNLPEEIQIGDVTPLESIGIQIEIKVPIDSKEDRFQIEYEFRH